jgi:putative colanic acid biosynthesis UDP-glucose lipid carrier transferase
MNAVVDTVGSRQPVLFKSSSALTAVVLALRTVVPAAVASLTLYVLVEAFAIRPVEEFSALLVLATVLSILVLQPARDTITELLLPRRQIAQELVLRWAVLLLILIAIGSATGQLSGYAKKVTIIWALVTPIPLFFVTMVLHEIARRVLCSRQNVRSAVFVGCNDTSRYLADRLSRHPELCMEVRGFFDDRNPKRLEAPASVGLLGSLADLPAFVKRNGIDIIFVSLPLRHIRRVHDLVRALDDTTASLYYLPDVFVSDLVQARASQILGVPVIAMRETPFHGYRGVAKRLMDVAFASLGLVLLSPLLALIALGIRATSPGPVVFHQRRYGLDGREIVIYKFRTMRVAEDSGWLDQARRDDARVTPFGKFLRRWSLDELPQLVNVLQGRMSLVGPRPHAVAHNEEYRRLIPGYMVRHKVPPGLTGLAQVRGYRGETRRLADMQARVHFDLEYVRNWSLLLDLQILVMTIPRLFNTDKAY